MNICSISEAQHWMKSHKPRTQTKKTCIARIHPSKKFERICTRNKRKRGGEWGIQATKENQVSLKRRLSAHQQENHCALKVIQRDEKVESNALSGGTDELRLLTSPTPSPFPSTTHSTIYWLLEECSVSFQVVFLTSYLLYTFKGEGWRRGMGNEEYQR